MDPARFDQLSKSLATWRLSRRQAALRVLVAAAAAGLAGTAGPSEARKRRGRGPKRDRVRAEQQQFCTTLCVDCSAKPIKPGANLARCDFDDESFADGLDLRSATLAGACFARAELRGARFGGATARGACFADADLTGASFRGATLGEAVFCGADLRGADFRGSTVKAEQLACATVGCDTILPNGKPAVACGPGERCCAGVCVDQQTDPANCGGCGNACATCQTCESGVCVAVPDNTVACDGSALASGAGGGVCTTQPRTGICAQGACECGALAVPTDTGGCVCNSAQVDVCVRNEPPDQCCQVEKVCIIDDFGVTETECIPCD